MQRKSMNQGSLTSLPSTDQFSNLSYLHLYLASATEKLRFTGSMEYLDVFAPNAPVHVICPNLKRSRLIANDVLVEENQGEMAVMCRLAATPLDWELSDNLVKLVVKGTLLTKDNIKGLKNLTMLHCMVSNATDFSMFSELPQLHELILNPIEKLNLMEISHPTLQHFGFGQMQYDGTSYAVVKTKFDFPNLKSILLEGILLICSLFDYLFHLGAVPFKYTDSLTKTLTKLNLVSCWRFISTIPFFTNLTHLHLSVKRLDFLDIVSESLQFLFVAKSNAVTDLRIDCPNLKYLSVHRLSKAKSIQILNVKALEGISIQYCKKLNPLFTEIFPKQKDFGHLKFFVSQYCNLDFDFLMQLLPLLPEKVHLLQLEGSPISLEIQDYLIQKFSYQLSRFEVLDKDILPQDTVFFPIHRFGAYDLRKDGVLEDLISWDLIFNAVGSQKKFGDKFSDKYMIKAPNCQLKHHNCWCKLREDELI